MAGPTGTSYMAGPTEVAGPAGPTTIYIYSRQVIYCLQLATCRHDQSRSAAGAVSSRYEGTRTCADQRHLALSSPVAGKRAPAAYAADDSPLSQRSAIAKVAIVM